MFDAALAELMEQAAAIESGEHAAMAVGAERELGRTFQQNLPRARVDRWHRSLAKYRDIMVIEAETILLDEVGGRLVVRGGAGHHAQRNRLAVTSSAGHDLLQKNLEQAGA